jgi:hypothetical protein
MMASATNGQLEVDELLQTKNEPYTQSIKDAANIKY